MQVFTAYEKPGPAGQGSDSDVILIQEGGSFWAMVLPVIWPVFHGLWLVLLGQLLIIAGLVILPVMLQGTGVVVTIVAAVLAVLMGLHGNDLRRWTLRQRGCAFSGIVAGQDIAEAERRLFTALGPHIYLS
jgi:hypothetical protein